MFEEISRSYAQRARGRGDISRADIAAAYARAVADGRLPAKLEDVHALAGVKRDFREVQGAMRVALADIGERLARLQRADDTGPRVELRSNGQLVVLPSERHPSRIYPRLMELLELRTLARYEDMLTHYLEPESASNPATESWREVLDLDDELNELLTEDLAHIGRRAALGVLGQAVSFAITASRLSALSAEALMACGVHARTPVQPPGMWLDGSYFARLVQFAYSRRGVRVRRLVFIDRQTLHDDRSTLHRYLSMLHGIGVEQGLLPLLDNTSLPPDYLVIPNARVLEYDRTDEAAYPFRSNWLWGTTDPDVRDEHTQHWKENWKQSIHLGTGRVDDALNALAAQLVTR